MNESKALGPVTATPDGKVVAVFATLGILDADGDVIARGAIPSGIPVPISAYGHTSWTGALPVGRGVITEEGDRAMLRGHLFLDTIGGRETYATLAGLRELAQWSFGYFPLAWHPVRQSDGTLVRVLDRLDVSEVSPVLVGAGVNTRTVELATHRQEQLELADMELGVRRDLAGVRRRDRTTGATFALAGVIRARSRSERAVDALAVAVERERAIALGVPVR